LTARVEDEAMSTIAPAALWRRHRRLALAKGLERVVAEAERPYVPSAAVPVDRHAVRECRDSLLELAAAVREVDNARPADLLLVRRLLVDADGPLFRPASPAQLRAAAEFARDALERAL
jgi:hypothetical protein